MHVQKKYPQLITIADPVNLGRYITDRNYIYSNNRLLVGATLNNFRIFSDTDYVADANTVFYNGIPMTDADASTFVVNENIDSGDSSNSGYDAKDKNHEYYEGVRVK